ncbi:hypothetical protein C1I99_17180 [Micromonospora deserti]|uniref:Epoxide hydrolase N-terminal domain-containing protein n=1 Tax=Micromonospora deserti TaxID=2070366 RepID=A0A2W2CF67_9ACTN|nr:hypothetical protein C1I99_17180 [Micromonospora deserti]
MEPGCRTPQFLTEIDGLDVHFLHVRSPEPDALPPATPEHFAQWLSAPRRWAAELFESLGLKQVTVEGAPAWAAAGDTDFPTDGATGVWHQRRSGRAPVHRDRGRVSGVVVRHESSVTRCSDEADREQLQHQGQTLPAVGRKHSGHLVECKPPVRIQRRRGHADPRVVTHRQDDAGPAKGRHVDAAGRYSSYE